MSRRFGVAKGAEGPLPAEAGAAGQGHGPGHGRDAANHQPTCSPTWAQPSADGRMVYVACIKSDEILEIDAGTWTLIRRFPTGRGPYNLAVTPDGRLLVATLKQGNAVQFFDLRAGTSLGQARSSTTLPHGVAVSPDGRYAFVSVEGVGAEPGKVDVFDLGTFARVADVPVGQQASGIAFWKLEPAR